MNEPNPHRIGACPECGSYRSDGRPPYLHRPGCPKEHDLQIERAVAEQLTGDVGGPVLWPDNEPVTPWADPWHDVAADLRDVHRRAGQEPPSRSVPCPDHGLMICPYCGVTEVGDG